MTKVVGHDLARCSFCTKGSDEVQKLIAGPGVYICDECVALCEDIITEELARQSNAPSDAKDPGWQRDTEQHSEPPTIRAWGGLSDEQLLAEMVRAHAAHQNVDRAVALHVATLRARGVSWARIGDALGMTRQSAWERFSGDE